MECISILEAPSAGVPLDELYSDVFHRPRVLYDLEFDADELTRSGFESDTTVSSCVESDTDREASNAEPVSPQPCFITREYSLDPVETDRETDASSAVALPVFGGKRKLDASEEAPQQLIQKQRGSLVVNVHTSISAIERLFIARPSQCETPCPPTTTPAPITVLASFLVDHFVGVCKQFSQLTFTLQSIVSVESQRDEAYLAAYAASCVYLDTARWLFEHNFETSPRGHTPLTPDQRCALAQPIMRAGCALEQAARRLGLHMTLDVSVSANRLQKIAGFTSI